MSITLIKSFQIPFFCTCLERAQQEELKTVCSYLKIEGDMINICHSEEQFSVLESPIHALSGYIWWFEIRKFVYHVCVTSSNMRSQYDILTFFTLKMIKTPIQGSVQSLARKCAKSAINLP